MLEAVGNDKTKLRVVIFRTDTESTDLLEAAHLINRTLQAKFIGVLTYIVTKSDAFIYSAYDFIIRLSMLEDKVTVDVESCLAATVPQTKVIIQPDAAAQQPNDDDITQKETTMTETLHESHKLWLKAMADRVISLNTGVNIPVVIKCYPHELALGRLLADLLFKGGNLTIVDSIASVGSVSRNYSDCFVLSQGGDSFYCYRANPNAMWSKTPILFRLDLNDFRTNEIKPTTSQQETTVPQITKKETMNVNTQTNTTTDITTDLDVITKHVTDATAFKEIMAETLMFVDQETVVVISNTGAVATKAEDIDKLNEQVLTMETRLPNLIDGKNEAFKLITALKQERDQQTAEQVKPEETKLHGTPRWGYGDNSGLNTAPSMPETKQEDEPLNPEPPVNAKVAESKLSEYQKHLTLWCKRLQVYVDEVKTSPPNFVFVTAQQAAIAAAIRPETAMQLGGTVANCNQALWLSAAIADVVCVLINDTDDVLSEVVPVSIWFARLSHDSARPRPKKMIDLVKANQSYFNHKVVQLLTARANTQVV